MTVDIMWIDLETTGLDAQLDLPLEIAVRVTDEDLVPGAMYTSRMPWLMVDIHARMDDVVTAMHTKNGLLAELAADNAHSFSVVGDPTLVVDQHLCQLATNVRKNAKGKVVLAGSSVHFDMGFVRRRFPAFAALCSHRLLDLSAVQQAMNLIQGRSLDHGFENNDAHRAASDVEQTLVRARRLWDEVRTLTGDTQHLAAMVASFPPGDEVPGFVAEARMALSGRRGTLADGRVWLGEDQRVIVRPQGAPLS